MSFWLKDGKIIVDSDGKPIDCQNEPCGKTYFAVRRKITLTGTTHHITNCCSKTLQYYYDTISWSGRYDVAGLYYFDGTNNVTIYQSGNTNLAQYRDDTTTEYNEVSGGFPLSKGSYETTTFKLNKTPNELSESEKTSLINTYCQINSGTSIDSNSEPYR